MSFECLLSRRRLFAKRSDTCRTCGCHPVVAGWSVSPVPLGWRCGGQLLRLCHGSSGSEWRLSWSCWGNRSFDMKLKKINDKNANDVEFWSASRFWPPICNTFSPSVFRSPECRAVRLGHPLSQALVSNTGFRIWVWSSQRERHLLHPVL